MRRIKLDILPVVLIYLNLIAIFKLLIACYLIADFNYTYVTILFLVSIGIIFFFHYVLYKFAYKLIGIISIAGIWIVWFLFNLSEFKNIIYSNYQFNTMALLEAVNSGKATFFAQYKPFILIILPIVLIILMFFSFRGHDNLILVADLAVLIVYWYIGYSMQVKEKLFSFSLLILFTYALNIYRKKITKYQKNGVRVQVSLIPVFFLAIAGGVFISFCISVLPQEYKGQYNSAFFNNFQNNFAKPIQNKSIKPDLLYDLNVSGYDESSSKKLGGPITGLSDAVVMKVKADSPLYLRGVVKDYYDGFSWNTGEYKYNDSNAVADGNDILKQYSDYTRTLKPDTAIKENTITLYPVDIKASSYFTPLNTYKVFDGDSIIRKNDAETFIKEKGSEISSVYDVYYYSNDLIPDDYGKFYNSNAGKEIINNQGIKDSSNEKRNYKKYLEVPGNITQRTRVLLSDITKDCSNDGEKVYKIYNYLKSNYPYTLNASDVPKGHEFVDYFLFTEKKGYCTYFATAATVLCRMAGIPARYVEGFHMADKKDDQGLYIVNDRMAHAWCEVLLSADNNTWGILDCTPGSYQMINNIYTSSSSTDPQSAENKPLVKHKINADNPKNNSQAGINSAANKQNQNSHRVNIVLLTLALIIFARILFLFIKKRRIIESNSVIPLYKYALKRLKSVFIVKPAAKTEVEFINDLYNTELKKNMKTIIPLVYREYYSKDRSRGNDDINRKKFFEFIEKHVRERQNIIKYLFVRFFTS